jgi:lysophospholipase L1-like esterase
MATSKADIILINLGLNDALYANIATPKASVETPNQYAQILGRLISMAEANGKVVVLEEPNPSCMKTRADVLPKYVAQLRLVGRQRNVAVIPQFDEILSMPGWTTWLGDCVHPSPAVYRLKAGRTLSVLIPLVRDFESKQSREVVN